MDHGIAQSNKFMLGSADILIGPMSDLYLLNTTDNSLGMVKNVAIEASYEYTDLQQGRMNEVVFSAKTGKNIKITGEGYEYTDKNLAYLAGMNGDTVVVPTGDSYTAQAGSTGSVIEVDSPASPQTIGVGDWILVYGSGYSTMVKVSSVANLGTGQLGVEQAVGASVPAGAKIRKVVPVDVGNDSLPEFVSAKIVGNLPNGDAFVAMFAKCRITGGLNLQFSSQDYGNTPIELTPMALVPTDPMYADFADTYGVLGMAEGVAGIAGV